MNDESFRVASHLINSKYIDQSYQAIQKRQRQFQTLLSQRCMPDVGWDDLSIQILIDQLSQMDCNNQLGTVGVGEREGRVFSSLVRQRHYHLSHGMGRSGDLTENQPKAAGSSLIATLCNHLVRHAMRLAGAQQLKQCVAVPMCTGMTMSLVMRALYLQFQEDDDDGQRLREAEQDKNKSSDSNSGNNNDNNNDRNSSVNPSSSSSRSHRKYVIWSRIDQKSCLKSIETAGFETVVIDCIAQSGGSGNDGGNEDGLCTDLVTMESRIRELGPHNILCVLSTTSCFAPRLPDKIVAIAKLCKKYGVGHIVDNAYGVQCRRTMGQISAAMSQGRVDAFIQSMDKNFMVPVGGAIVASNNVRFMNRVASTYAGRASLSPVLDLFITLLSMGVNHWNRLLNERMELLPYFATRLHEMAAKYGERVLATSHNTISFAVTADHFPCNPVHIGAQLFYRGVTGIRIVTRGAKKQINGLSFVGYGSGTNAYPHHYLTVACALGMRREEIDQFFVQFDKVLHKMGQKRKKEKEKHGNDNNKNHVEDEARNEQLGLNAMEEPSSGQVQVDERPE